MCVASLAPLSITCPALNAMCGGMYGDGASTVLSSPQRGLRGRRLNKLATSPSWPRGAWADAFPSVLTVPPPPHSLSLAALTLSGIYFQLGAHGWMLDWCLQSDQSDAMPDSRLQGGLDRGARALHPGAAHETTDFTVPQCMACPCNSLGQPGTHARLPFGIHPKITIRIESF